MRILHTSDWHVGRTIRGRSRDDEQRAVLAEIGKIARTEEVDLVLVAGDLFDTAAPSPQSEEIVYKALLDLVSSGAHVVLIAGNHDNPRRLAAVRPLLELARVHCVTEPLGPDDGGCIEIRTRSGETAKVAVIPWLSQRRIVSATALMQQHASDHASLYASQYREFLNYLSKDFGRDAVNLVMAHAAIVDAVTDGSERMAQTIFDYCVPAQAFPQSAHYVALGHFHRAQQCPAATKIWYSGSPLQLDFGDTDDRKCVLIVDAKPNVPSEVREVRLTAGRALKTLRGRLEEVIAQADGLGDAYLRVFLDEQARVGLADAVRERLPNAVDVRVIQPQPDGQPQRSTEERDGSPVELFTRYLEERNATDERVLTLFNELLEEALAADAS
ncbi:MAG: exonuclease SbcCD subunit D [Dehalococcoidia bacterium]|nr:exonuclease SbcCD subunit D [Dehalococcoidia bacterium]